LHWTILPWYASWFWKEVAAFFSTTTCYHSNIFVSKRQLSIFRFYTVTFLLNSTRRVLQQGSPSQGNQQRGSPTVHWKKFASSRPLCFHNQLPLSSTYLWYCTDWIICFPCLVTVNFFHIVVSGI
jgi:hypothetical protein